MAYSDGWRDVGSPDLIKIFLEYYDSHHAQLAFDMSAGLQVNVQKHLAHSENFNILEGPSSISRILLAPCS